MTSERKIEANQQNALKSTGPRSDGGKRRTRLNALRHGLFAEQLLITGEDPTEFSALEEDISAELAPLGPFEEMLVDQIVRDLWRLNRLQLAEQAYLEATKNALFIRTVRSLSKEESKLFSNTYPDQGRLQSIMALETEDDKATAQKHRSTDLLGSIEDLLQPEPTKQEVTITLNAKIDRAEKLGTAFLDAIVRQNERLSMAELDRLRRGLIRDVMQKRVALDALQERRSTIDAD